MSTKSGRKASKDAGPPPEAEAASAGAAGSDDEVSDNRQFVTFIVGSEVFAVSLAPVQEIIRVPSIVRVPLAPAALDGLANLRGRILPIVSLRRASGMPDKEHDDATRALVIDYGQALGFVVDKVLSVITVDPSQIEDVGTLQATVNTDLLAGIIKDAGGHAMIMILDFEKLIAREFSTIAGEALSGRRSDAVSEGTSAESDEDAVSDELQLVSFSVAGQEYAIPIEAVQEIVQVPEQVVQVPRSASHVLGMITLRQRVLPLVSLRRMFALPEQAANERSRIVVVALGGVSVGIVTDSVNEVLRVSKSAVDPMPALLAREEALADISRLCQLDGGKRIVSIVDPDNLFNHAAIQEAVTTVDRDNGAGGATASEQGNGEDDDEQVVVFRLDAEEFGVPIESVQEIVRVPDELTRVPKSPTFVEGVINLRGAVLPVIDLRTRLGLPTVERSDRQRVMVFLLDGTRTGFIVDSVAEVLRIRKSMIEPAPRLSSDQSRLLTRMANLEAQKRMVQLIVPAQLVDGEDLHDLAELAA
jgi:purine-binding chemotaxis protein CheW